jgi:hypothetical protein
MKNNSNAFPESARKKVLFSSIFVVYKDTYFKAYLGYLNTFIFPEVPGSIPGAARFYE